MGLIKTKQEMEVAIVSVFAHNLKVDKLFTTPDGNCFTDAHIAAFHVSRNKDMKVTEVKREDYAEQIVDMISDLAVKKANREKAGADVERKAEEAKVAAKAAADKKAETAAKESAEKVTAELKAQATALSIKLEGTETDEELRALIVAEEKEVEANTPKYAEMEYKELKALCDTREIAYVSNISRLNLIGLLEADDASKAGK